MADTTDLKSVGFVRVGSTPTVPTCTNKGNKTMYKIYDWHRGAELLGENMTLEEVIDFYVSNHYRYIKIDKIKEAVYVSNCCWFNYH